MNISMELVNTSYNVQQIPHFPLPQVAMAGRSNVGKSSLINALAGRKKLAKVSSTPGKTRSINFYLVKPYEFYLVDLPGYGYARASHKERQAWADTLEAYLSGDSNLRGLALLLDCRLTPQKLDLDLARYAENINLPLIPILTKVDKCSQKERMARQQEWQDILNIKPLLVSASKHSGLEKVWKAIIQAAVGTQAETTAENKPEDQIAKK